MNPIPTIRGVIAVARGLVTRPAATVTAIRVTTAMTLCDLAAEVAPHNTRAQAVAFDPKGIKQAQILVIADDKMAAALLAAGFGHRCAREARDLYDLAALKSWPEVADPHDPVAKERG